MFEHIAWYNKALDFSKNKEHEKELYCYDRALEIKPNDSIVIHNRNETTPKLVFYPD